MAYATKLIFSFISVLFIVWFSVPFIFKGILNIGNASGIVVFLCLLLYTLRFRAVNSFILKLYGHFAGKLLIFAFCIVFLTAIIYVAFVTSKMISACIPKNDNRTAVVLGCKVYNSGPSLMLIERLDAAIAYLNKNTESACVLSGGQGSDEPSSEAQAMFDYMTERGISPDRLFLEDKSTSTAENLEFSKSIIEKNGLNPKITVITNDFHCYRAIKIAKRLGLSCDATAAHTLIWLFPTYYVRELYAILYEAFFR